MDTATLEARLAEAETALHKLQMGKSVATVKYDGREVSYSKSTIHDLKAYVQELKVSLGLASARRSHRVTYR